MDLDGTILVSLVVMLAVIASIVRDLRVYRRRRDRALSWIAQPAAPSPAFPPAIELAGAIGDPDPIHELAQRLGALRSLGLDHVRTAHPLFRAPAGAPALAFDAEPVDAVPAPARRPRHGRLRSTTPLRLVVSRPELP